LIDNILYYKNRLLKGEIPENIYDELNEIAAQVPAGSNKLIVTPWLNGERTPVDDNTVRAGIYNVSKTTTQDDIVRAFLREWPTTPAGASSIWSVLRDAGSIP